MAPFKFESPDRYYIPSKCKYCERTDVWLCADRAVRRPPSADRRLSLSTLNFRTTQNTATQLAVASHSAFRHIGIGHRFMSSGGGRIGAGSFGIRSSLAPSEVASTGSLSNMDGADGDNYEDCRIELRSHNLVSSKITRISDPL